MCERQACAQPNKRRRGGARWGGDDDDDGNEVMSHGINAGPPQFLAHAHPCARDIPFLKETIQGVWREREREVHGIETIAKYMLKFKKREKQPFRIRKEARTMRGGL